MRPKYQLLYISILTIVMLGLIDLGMGLMFGTEKFQPQNSKIDKYFGYGISVKRKLDILIGNDDKEAKSISKAGWVDGLPAREVNDLNCKRKVTFYGMSFSNRIADRLVELDPCMAVRKVDGPGAPLSHSYYAFKKLGAIDDSEIVVLSVLASTLPKLATVAQLNSAFEYPSAHFYPRYYLEEGLLTSSGVPVESLSRFREIIRDDQSLDKLTQFMEAHDSFYDPWVFGNSWADKSYVLRMLRRSYAGNHIRAVRKNYFTQGSFNNYDQLIDISRALVMGFSQHAKNLNRKVVVILIEDGGYYQALSDVFSPLIESQEIDVFNSNQYIDSRDKNNFIYDGHFTRENDELLAKALLEKIRGFQLTSAN